ncbi:MAG: VWA domain-containing protein, partial [Planctomycetales bacterium]|nr:VWA domain-containing protein [Planctomycetales bacterium]
VDGFRAGGLTAIGNALTMGSDSLVFDANNRSYAFKTVIVMTDGNHNTGPSPDVTVDTAVARGQTVHTITFSGGANQRLMGRVAAATQGGIHIHADDAEDLAAAFRAIARTLSVTLVE